VRDGLGVGGDAVVLGGGEVDEARAEAGEDGLDLAEGRVGRAVLDEDQGLVVGVDGRAVEGVAGDDVDVLGEVALKRLDLGGFAGRLGADDGAEFGSCACWSETGSLLSRCFLQVWQNLHEERDGVQGPYWAITRSIRAASTL
jgi:hypothetical protein